MHIGKIWRRLLHPLQSLRIGTRLTVCFAFLIGLTVLAALFASWELNLAGLQIAQLDQTDREVIAILHVNNAVLSFSEMAQDSAQREDLARL